MVTRIEIFEKNETKYFKNTSLRALRNSKKQKPLAFEMRRRNVFGKAYVQVYPDQIILENFPLAKDSINLDVLNIIDSLKVRGLDNFGDSTQLEFWHKDEYVILYRNKPYNRNDVLKNTIPKQVIRNWNYFTFKFTGGD
jgi:hypothetical protein